jgi:hypothetical protein
MGRPKNYANGMKYSDGDTITAPPPPRKRGNGDALCRCGEPIKSYSSCGQRCENCFVKNMSRYNRGRGESIIRARAG